MNLYDTEERKRFNDSLAKITVPSGPYYNLDFQALQQCTWQPLAVEKFVRNNRWKIKIGGLVNRHSRVHLTQHRRCSWNVISGKLHRNIGECLDSFGRIKVATEILILPRANGSFNCPHDAPVFPSVFLRERQSFFSNREEINGICHGFATQTSMTTDKLCCSDSK